MKLGASMLNDKEYGLEFSLNYFENRKEIDYMEIIHDFPYRGINDNKDLIDLINSYSLSYTIHSPLMDINLASPNDAVHIASIEEIKRSIDLANKIDSDIVVIHPGRMSFLVAKYSDLILKKSDKSFTEIAKYSKDCGVDACIENLPNMGGFMYANLKELNELVNKFDLSMTLDLGHAHNSGFKIDEMYYDKIKHIHLHDNFGDGDSHMALGEGNIDFKSFFKSFNKKRYDGIYMLELYLLEAVEKSIEYLNKLK